MWAPEKAALITLWSVWSVQETMSYDCLSADGIMTPGAFGLSLPFAGATYCNLPTVPIWKGVPMPHLTSEPQSPQITNLQKKLSLESRKHLIPFPQRQGGHFQGQKIMLGLKLLCFCILITSHCWGMRQATIRLK